MTGIAEGGDFGLEGRDLFTKDELAAVEHSRDSFEQFVGDRFVLRREIDEGNGWGGRGFGRIHSRDSGWERQDPLGGAVM